MAEVTNLDGKRQDKEMLEYFDKEIKEVKSELMEQWARLEVLELFKSSLGEK